VLFTHKPNKAFLVPD